jgi:hypothetical protein
LCAWPEGCASNRATADYCQKHYKYVRSFGLPDAPSGPGLLGPCKEPGCDDAVVAQGWCGNHYWHWRKHGDPYGGPGRKPPPVIRKHALNEAFFDEVTTERQAYWLGFIVADGNIQNSSGHHVLQVKLQKRDSGHLVQMREDMAAGVPVKVERSSGNAYIHISSKHLIESLDLLGVTPRKSFTAEPWNGPEHLMPHYWRGLFDGDGCITRRATAKRAVSWYLILAGSHACLAAFGKWSAAACGTKASPFVPASGYPVYSVGGSKTPQRLAAAMYGNATIALPRKMERARELMACDFDAMYGRHPGN